MTMTPASNKEHNDEIRQLDIQIRILVESKRPLIHRALKALGELADTKTQAVVADAKVKSKTLVGTKQARTNVSSTSKKVDELLKQLDSLKQQLK